MKIETWQDLLAELETHAREFASQYENAHNSEIKTVLSNVSFFLFAEAAKARDKCRDELDANQ